VHLAYNGKETANICIYVRKDSPESKGVEALKGKRVSMIGLWDWVYLQNYLKEKGIDKRNLDYFSDIALSKNDESGLYAVIFKKSDAFIATDTSFLMASRADKRFKNITQSECMGLYPNGPIVVNPGVDKKDVEQLAGIFLNSYKDKDFKDFKIYFVAASARFVRVGADFYKPYIKLLQAARKAVWVGDFDKWQRKQAAK